MPALMLYRPLSRSISRASVAALAVLAMAAPTTASAGAGPAVAAPCLRAEARETVVEGQLTLLEGLGPAAFLVIVPGGVCLDAAEPNDRVARADAIQVYATTAEGMQTLYRLAGERVRVRGTPSGRRVLQQRAPILMEITDIAPR